MCSLYVQIMYFFLFLQQIFLSSIIILINMQISLRQTTKYLSRFLNNRNQFLTFGVILLKMCKEKSDSKIKYLVCIIEVPISC